MKRPLAGGIDLRLHIDRGSRRYVDDVLDGVPLAVAIVEDRPHPVEMHGVAHHRLVDEFDAYPLAILKPDWV